MTTTPRTPEFFPRMKDRARGRLARRKAWATADLSEFLAACREAVEALTKFYIATQLLSQKTPDHSAFIQTGATHE